MLLRQFKIFGDKRTFRKYRICENTYQGRNIWLIKPNDFNRGRGVKLFNSLSELRV